MNPSGDAPTSGTRHGIDVAVSSELPPQPPVSLLPLTRVWGPRSASAGLTVRIYPSQGHEGAVGTLALQLNRVCIIMVVERHTTLLWVCQIWNRGDRSLHWCTCWAPSSLVHQRRSWSRSPSLVQTSGRHPVGWSVSDWEPQHVCQTLPCQSCMCSVPLELRGIHGLSGGSFRRWECKT